MGDASKLQTPKGLFTSQGVKIKESSGGEVKGDIKNLKEEEADELSVSSNIGLYMSYYIANYKGGRNESFMYGLDDKTMWYDYDLTSAYTSVMALLGNPQYNESRMLEKEELDSMSFRSILYSYIVMKVSFEFKEDIKYPSIPCYIDEVATVYPLRGEAVLTGAEYLLARKQGCNLRIMEIFYLPFQEALIKDEESQTRVSKPVNHPFQ
jgi:hypothetical protein